VTALLRLINTGRLIIAHLNHGADRCARYVNLRPSTGRGPNTSLPSSARRQGSTGNASVVPREISERLTPKRPHCRGSKMSRRMPEEFAEAVIFLCSDRASHVTGHESIKKRVPSRIVGSDSGLNNPAFQELATGFHHWPCGSTQIFMLSTSAGHTGDLIPPFPPVTQVESRRAGSSSNTPSGLKTNLTYQSTFRRTPSQNPHIGAGRVRQPSRSPSTAPASL
jgi:hypothetical protein